MSKTSKLTWLTLGIATAVLAAVAGWFAMADAAQAQVITVAPGGTTSVAVSSTASVGALDATVTYDSTVVSATACTPNTAWDAATCDVTTAGTVSMLFADVAGITGSLADITFQAVGADGATTALTLTVNIITDNVEVPITGSPVSLSASSITIQTPAPTATPAAPTATPAAPTATPAAAATPTPAVTITAPVPSGSGQADGGLSGWWLAALAMGLLTATGGVAVWRTARRRQQ